VMEYASQYYNYPADDFVKPSDVQLGTVSALTGLLPHQGEPTTTDWFINGTMPTVYGQYTPPQPKPCNGDNCPNPPIFPCPPFCGPPNQNQG
jgi:hypothetical protein